MTWDESYVSVGGLLGTTELGLHFGEETTFYGVEHTMEHVVEHVMKCAVELILNISHGVVRASRWV